ncbi:MAG: beta-galactosidase [Victivallales bacterium]|jgi:beta-galactosidase|nr:beta-galactosidase [Victivallales bacterium]
MKYFGCAYYPEAWPPERISEDIRLMKEAHINCVRMGEFNWGNFEPHDGVFHFKHYRDVIKKLYEHNISTILCTPTAAPPKWMSHRYSDILKKTAANQSVYDGNRRHYCPSSVRYRDFSKRIVAEMSKAFSDLPGVVGWQLDNEIAAEAETGFCFCPQCEKRFQMFLKHKYETIEQLNEAWNGSFWSGKFSDFEEISPRNLRRTIQLAAYARFMSTLYTEFACEQRDILRKVNPDWTIVSNSWISFIPDIEPEELVKNLDRAACDCYIAGDHIEFYHAMWDLYRNLKDGQRKFWICETGAWNPDSSIKGNEKALRVWAYDALFHGAESLFYFRWRQSVMGEENHPAILPHSGIPGATYQIIRQIGEELPNLDCPEPYCPVLIVTDTLTGFMAKYRDGGDYSYFHAIVRANQALNRLGICSDIISSGKLTEEALKKYQLVILPQIEYVSEELIAALKEYAANGGVILAQCRLNRLTQNGAFRQEAFPYAMRELFGLRIDEWCNICNLRIFMNSPTATSHAGNRCHVWNHINLGKLFFLINSWNASFPKGAKSWKNTPQAFMKTLHC